MDFILNILKFMIQDKVSFVDIRRIKIHKLFDKDSKYNRFEILVDKKYFEENK